MDRKKIIIKTSILGIIVNLVLVAFKAIIGFLVNSIALDSLVSHFDKNKTGFFGLIRYNSLKALSNTFDKDEFWRNWISASEFLLILFDIDFNLDIKSDIYFLF